jgi:hypothetical protein
MRKITKSAKNGLRMLPTASATSAPKVSVTSETPATAPAGACACGWVLPIGVMPIRMNAATQRLAFVTPEERTAIINANIIGDGFVVVTCPVCKAQRHTFAMPGLAILFTSGGGNRKARLTAVKKR